MTFLDDAADAVAATIVTIGLSTSSDVAGEVSGGGYAPLAPSYVAASDGSADLSATLEFDGPASAGPVTHLIFRTVDEVTVRPATSPVSFNSDGRLDLTSAPVSAAFPA